MKNKHKQSGPSNPRKLQYFGAKSTSATCNVFFNCIEQTPYIRFAGNIKREWQPTQRSSKENLFRTSTEIEANGIDGRWE